MLPYCIDLFDMEIYKFDIFIDGHFKTTMCLKYPPRWVFSEEELTAEALNRYPSLKGKRWSIGLA